MRCCGVDVGENCAYPYVKYDLETEKGSVAINWFCGEDNVSFKRVK